MGKLRVLEPRAGRNKTDLLALLDEVRAAVETGHATSLAVILTGKDALVEDGADVVHWVTNGGDYFRLIGAIFSLLTTLEADCWHAEE